MIQVKTSLSSKLIHTRVFPLQVPIHVPFTISRETLPCASLILIEIENERGLIGLGESAPFPSLTKDTIAIAQPVAEGLLAEINGLPSYAALEKLRGLRKEASAQSITAFVGVEGALLDLLAREQGCTLASLWGDSGKTYLATDITLPIMEPAAIASFWQIYSSFGFETIKIKVSGQLDSDLDMILALKALVPQTSRFILDGNQGFTVAAAEQLVDRLLALGVKPLFFEQALPEDDVRGIQKLSQSLPIPLCLDESVRTVQDLQKILLLGLRPMVNIKLMKTGIEQSRQLIAMAQKAGLLLMMGGMFESEVAMGISLQMALGSGAITYADLDTPFFFKQRLTKDSPWHAETAILQLSKGFGHGLERSVP